MLGKGDYAYMLDFENVGGLVTPVIVEMTYSNGKTDMLRIPAEVWRQDPKKFSKLILSEKQIVAFAVDPWRETADVDVTNNDWPRKIRPSRLEVFKSERPKGRNMMKDFETPLKKDDDKDGEKDESRAE